MESSNSTFSYLTFKLGAEIFASHVSQVINILELVRITEVPKSPDYMKGVINLRGQVLPVVDARVKFGMPAMEFTKNTCIIVMVLKVEGQTVEVGVLVDSVQEVLEIDSKDILASPSIGSKYRSEFIKGMVKQGEQFVMLLDMDRVFSTDEFSIFKETTDGVEIEVLPDLEGTL